MLVQRRFKPVHVKTPASQRRRLLLTSRKLLQRKVQDLENDLRGGLRNFGLKVGVVGAAGFDRRVRELAAGEPFVAAVVGPLLEARAMLRLQLAKLHKMLLDLVRDDAVCRRLMTVPGRRRGSFIMPTIGRARWSSATGSIPGAANRSWSRGAAATAMESR